ncbi:hypothetical protein RND81_12G088200 [Saponaria officinalis]|uniref:Uncharacterized protein n=1 Tax=Saponaria officinalis TaxID=3572 RepID=A0AAW1H892_SAPOF
MVLIERVSSISSSSSSRKTGKKQTLSSEKENREVVKGKSVKRASSFSSLKKEKQTQSNTKDVHEKFKSKYIKRASSFSSLPSSLRKEKLVRQGTSLSSSNVESPRKVRKSLSNFHKEKQPETRKKSLLMSKIKELGPICKKRKDIVGNVDIDADLQNLFGREIDEGTMINPDDCFWLSSGHMSPQEFGVFMNALDPCLDEWVISFVPNLSDNKPASSEDAGLVSEDENAASNTLALSTHTNNSAFWNMDRTGVWVSLINLEGEDSRLISDSISDDDSLDSNFPSPTYEHSWDTCSSENLGVSSSARSTTHESSHSDWSSDLLSDSLDWDVDSEDPIFWPFGLGSGSGWDQNLESFSVSPRKGTYERGIDSENDDGVVSSASIKFRLHGKKDGSKDGFKKKILFVSGLSASKIIEFKKGCRKNLATSRGARHKRTQTGKRAGRFGKRVPPILETDLEGISPKETPTKETRDLVDFDMLSGSEDWGDEMDDDSDGPLVWPTDQKTDWNVTCDFLNISPRKNVVSITNLGNFGNFGSPKGGFTVSSSVRLKFRPNKKSKTKQGLTLSSLGASKCFKFKPESYKTSVANSRKRAKAAPLRLSPSCKSLVVIIPPKKTSLFKQVGANNGISRINASHGKRVRAMPFKIGKSVEEFIRMASVGSVQRKLTARGLNSDEITIETVMGLNEFDGHEGVDMDFEGDEFSFEECIRD